MKKLPRFFTILAFVCSIATTVFAQSEKDRVTNYITQYKDLAIAEMLRAGIPASITLAQGILETGGGQSDLASLANNHFGIKCKTEWIGDRMFHDDDEKGECFRKYKSAEESYKDHSEFLLTRPHYAFLFKLDPTDFQGWAMGLKKAGYATNPQYPQRLMKIIIENNLQQFTLLALQMQSHKEEELFATEKPKVNSKEVVSAPVSEPVVAVNSVGVSNLRTNIITPNKKTTSAYPFNQVFAINDIKVIYAESGTSLLALANNYSVTLKKLLDFNELANDEITKRDQLIFLEKKSKHGATEIHIVEGTENLHDIAQAEGIQLQSLLEYNKLQKGMIPAAGEKLYLKAASPSSPRLAFTSFTDRNVSMK